MKIIILDEYGVLDQTKLAAEVVTHNGGTAVFVRRTQDKTIEQSISEAETGIGSLTGVPIYAMRRVGTVKHRDKVGGAK